MMNLILAKMLSAPGRFVIVGQIAVSADYEPRGGSKHLIGGNGLSKRSISTTVS